MSDPTELLKLASYDEEDSTFEVELPKGHKLTFEHYRTAARERSLTKKANKWATSFYNTPNGKPMFPKEWQSALDGAEDDEQIGILSRAYILEKTNRDGYEAGVFVQLSANNLVWNAITQAFDVEQVKRMTRGFADEVKEAKND